MSRFKNFAGQTAIYGVGTVLAKVLNFLVLTRYYTTKLGPEQYGIFTDLYAYAAFINVVLLFGLETGFFNFASKDKDRSKDIFSSIFISVLSISSIFFVTVFVFRNNIADVLRYESNVEYISIFAIILSFDALSTILMAKLRFENKAVKFSLINLVNVIITIVLVLFFFEVVPGSKIDGAVNKLFSVDRLVDYVFYSNLIASVLKFLLLVPELKGFKVKFYNLKNILKYSWPLFISGLAGLLNDVIDRNMFKFLYPDPDRALYELGIYGGNLRLGMIISLLVTMYRYTAEPFFFNVFKDKDSKVFYARMLNYFVAFLLVVFLLVNLYIGIFKNLLLDKEFWVGLSIVPVVLFGYLLYGILFNINFWFKVTNKTWYAILVTGIGLSITFLINLIFIPKYSYYACAYARVISFGVMVIVSFLLGRKYYRINYDLKKLGFYFLIAGSIFLIDKIIDVNSILEFFMNSVLLMFFIFTVWKKENLKSLLHR